MTSAILSGDYFLSRRAGGKVSFCKQMSTADSRIEIRIVVQSRESVISPIWEACANERFLSGGEAMRYASIKIGISSLALVAILFMTIAVVISAPTQEKKGAQQNGVDNSKMGPYRALAQHIYVDFQKGDLAGAAEMARVLERLWDKAEDYGGDTALSKTNRKLFDDIDKAMDQFITHLTEAKGKAPDPVKFKAAYNAYLDKLKQAD
jgi:hypothetical protein